MWQFKVSGMTLASVQDPWFSSLLHMNVSLKIKCTKLQLFVVSMSMKLSHLQQTVAEQHHRTGPTSTENVCTYIVEQTQGSTWQLKTFLTHRGIIYNTAVILSVSSVFICFFLPFCSTRCFYLALMFTERQFLHNKYHRSFIWLLTDKF
jgi:hypothetical protein